MFTLIGYQGKKDCLQIVAIWTIIACHSVNSETIERHKHARSLVGLNTPITNRHPSPTLGSCLCLTIRTVLRVHQHLFQPLFSLTLGCVSKCGAAGD